MLREFIDWWLSQLKAWLPDSIKAHLREGLCLLYLDVKHDTVRVHARYRKQALEFGQVPLDGAVEGSHPELTAFLASLPKRPDRILVRIATGGFLQREVELPLAAEDSLNQAISFQLEQLTPFSADQVMSFSGISKRLPSEKKLLAWLVVTPTERINKALQLLEGPAPTLLAMPAEKPVQDGRLQLAYRPFGHSDGDSFRGTFLLGGLLVLLLGATIALHINNRLETREHLQQALSAIQPKASEAGALHAQISAIQRQADFLASSQRHDTSFLSLWNDLSERLEDDTWLQRIDLREQKISLQGISRNASRLIEQLEQSPYLEKVSFASSVTRDRNTDNERFNISAVVLKPQRDAS